MFHSPCHLHSLSLPFHSSSLYLSNGNFAFLPLTTSSSSTYRPRPSPPSSSFPLLLPLPYLCHFLFLPSLPLSSLCKIYCPLSNGIVYFILQTKPDKNPVYKSLSIVRRGFCLEGFIRGGFCSFPFCQNTFVRPTT